MEGGYDIHMIQESHHVKMKMIYVAAQYQGSEGVRADGTVTTAGLHVSIHLDTMACVITFERTEEFDN